MKTEAKPIKDMGPRIRELHVALSKAVEAKGHKAGTGWATIQGESLSWTIYEPSVMKKIPLSEKELADRFSITSKARERGWKQGFEPSGSLALVIDAKFHTQARIADTRKLLLEDRIDAIIDKLEAMATEVVERRKQLEEDQRRAEEKRKRREARLARERIEDRKWDEFNEIANDWIRAEQLRRFVRSVAKRNEASPDPSGRVQEWLAWARPYIDGLDPLWNGIESLLERLYPPEVSEYELNFGEPEDIDD